MRAAAHQGMITLEVFKKMTFEQFKTTMLMGLATLFVSIAGFMASSLWSLNEKMAVIVEKVATQGDLLRRHDEEIRQLRIQAHVRTDYNLGAEKEVNQ
jgi:hypothetical protein